MKNIAMTKLAKKISVLGSVLLVSLSPLTSNAVELVNFMVSEEGIHRLTYEELLQQGVDLKGLNNQRFKITSKNQQVPIYIKGEKTKGKNSSVSKPFFGPGGYIEFYAAPELNLYSSEQAFTLHFMDSPEANKTSQLLFNQDQATPNTKKPSVQSYRHTATFEQNNYYDFAAPSNTDPWHYGQTYSFWGTPTYQFELDNVVGGTASATLKAQVYGLLDFEIEGNDHHYEVMINDILLGDRQFDGNSSDVFNAESVVVQNGQNTFKFNYRPIAAVPFDIIALNKFDITYERQAVVNNGYLSGWFNGQQAAVSGIASDDFAVYRKNDDQSIDRLQSELAISGEIVFNPSGLEGDYIVVAGDGYKKPRVQNLLSYQNITEGEAEYLIIAHPVMFGSALSELENLRSQEYKVKTVDVEQIYSQFGSHVRDAGAIERYIAHAVANMGTKYVVLVGNDTYDYKNYVTDSVSLIPTLYTSTPGGWIEVTQTASDAAYGDLNKDGVPELAIGRISARSVNELQIVVNKIKAYEQREGYAGLALIAADKEDSANGISFTQDAKALIAAMPQLWQDALREDFRAFPDIDGGQLAHEKTLTALNAGVSVVNFIGHSSHRRWSFSTPPILTSNQVRTLQNFGKPAVVTQWGCWNSYFVDPAGNTMADEFMLSSEAGAATVLGASTLTTSEGERGLGVELNKRMYQRGVTIGNAVIQAKQALADSGSFPAIQYGWQILGDPALKISP